VGAEPVPVHPLITAAVTGESRLRGVHQQMVDAALSDAGIERIAQLACEQIGRPVEIAVPGRAPVLSPAAAEPGQESLLTVPVDAGGEAIGTVSMLPGPGPVPDDAAEILHLAAIATLTTLALEDAREQTADRLGAGLIDELRREKLDAALVMRRATRLGCDLRRGAVVLVTAAGDRRPRQAAALITSEYKGAIAELLDGRLYALLPAHGGDEAPELTVKAAVALAGRLRSYGPSGVSSFYTDPAELRRAIQEAELVLEVVSRDERMAEQLNGGMGSGVYRLLFRALASHPEEVRSFYEDTVAAVVRYDDQYHTDLLSTLETYLANDCNMNATARAIYAHRHTVAYRLQRMKELTGLDPMISEDRERLSLGLKAYRIVAPTLPR
jgi:sugar diacid utilization regulator